MDFPYLLKRLLKIQFLRLNHNVNADYYKTYITDPVYSTPDEYSQLKPHEDILDFEPELNFLSEEETFNELFGYLNFNSIEDYEMAKIFSKKFKIFARGGDGSILAFWNINEEIDILLQPLVFFGSEGELHQISRNFYEFSWLLAYHIEPYCMGFSFFVDYTITEYYNTKIQNESINSYNSEIDYKFKAFAEEFALLYKELPHILIQKAHNKFAYFFEILNSIYGNNYIYDKDTLKTSIPLFFTPPQFTFHELKEIDQSLNYSFKIIKYQNNILLKQCLPSIQIEKLNTDNFLDEINDEDKKQFTWQTVALWYSNNNFNDCLLTSLQQYSEQNQLTYWFEKLKI